MSLDGFLLTRVERLNGILTVFSADFDLYPMLLMLYPDYPCLEEEHSEYHLVPQVLRNMVTVLLAVDNPDFDLIIYQYAVSTFSNILEPNM